MFTIFVLVLDVFSILNAIDNFKVAASIYIVNSGWADGEVEKGTSGQRSGKGSQFKYINYEVWQESS